MDIMIPSTLSVVCIGIMIGAMIFAYFKKKLWENYIFGRISSLLIIDALQLPQMSISSGSSSEPQIEQYFKSKRHLSPILALR